MRLIRVFQLTWSGLLLTSLFLDAWSFEFVAVGSLLALALIYVLACILALGSSRIAWVVTLAMPLVFLTRGGLMAGINILGFARRDPLYSDVLATLIVVLGYALLFILPAAALLFLFWRERPTLRALLVGPSMRSV